MERFKQLWPQNKSYKIVVIFIVVLLIFRTSGYGRGWLSSWSGNLAPSPDANSLGQMRAGWVELLVITAALATGAWMLVQRLRGAERESAEAHRLETRLRAYIDTMTRLLLDKGLHLSDEHNEVRDQTLTMARSLDGKHKGLLLCFLRDADLILKDNPIIHLAGADLSEAILDRADLSGAGLSGADLSRARLIGAGLQGADLRKARLRRANLLVADLSRAGLSQADLQGALMTEANLQEAQLSRANLSGATLSLAVLTRADMQEADLRGADLSGANLRSADLSGADLSGVYLIQADLGGADLRGATLTQAVLFEASLDGADLRGADLRGADLSGIMYDESTLWPEQVSRSRYM